VAFGDYVERRRQLPFFANARSIRNALDRGRLRQANRLFNRMGERLAREELMTIEAADILASRVFLGEVEGEDPSQPLTDPSQSG
ncbi:MAG: CbbX protein, partial [Prochlorococcaceae cyanobacterium ETNP18_MAG_1]|nr:CbbX protein [Prochlorococcaceae cyanobacterium ETNP18_MAG_1]